MKAAMRRTLTILSLSACLLPSASAINSRDQLGPHAVISADRVPLDGGDAARTRLGALTYLGGVRLRSPDPAFGGFSAMQVIGDRFLLVSDGGQMVRFRLDRDFRLTEPSFGDVRDGPVTGWQKADRDVESLAHDPVSGKIWLGFERENQIWRYDSLPGRGERFAAPPAMAGWPRNGGAESMVRLRDGRFIVISETARARGGKGRIALMFSGDPTEAPTRGFRFAFMPPPGFDPSDITQLPDGRLVVLLRRFSLGSLFTAKLMLVDLAAIRPGVMVRGREIADFSGRVTRDNFEAIAAVREGRDTILWIASDDNQQIWERTLLLKFRLNL